MTQVQPKITQLTVLYDGECTLCDRLKRRLQQEPVWIRLDFLAFQNPAVPRRFPGIERFEPAKHLVVIDDQRNVYCAECAWIMILYATRAYREIAVHLTAKGLRPLAREACRWISLNRKSLHPFLKLKAHPPGDAT